jgi:hypothetical protein
MSGDYTRLTHDPRKRYESVLMQQGRVQLDADWNEAAEIERRRLRLLALDSFGPVGVPYLTTPDAFLIGALAGDLSIQPGRLYVEGLLAEILPDEVFTYLTQPFLPDPPPLPGGPAVVYLDVWEREVTWVHDPELLDVALGGADTATRLQTVWQLRVDGQDRAACGMDVGEAASAGRLTSRAIAPPAPDDPCILPPTGGYRGLENRLYRVEIHEGGAIGTARFKWSRDNGSILASVLGLATGATDTTLTLDRLGRDPVLRFRIDDWVTISDEHRELHGQPGAMARITAIDEAERRITLDRALPTAGAGAFPTAQPALGDRHVRVQRWDQSAATNTLDGDGLITTAAGPIALEDGIEIELAVDPAGGAFCTGDWWVFAARVADASVEELTAAPPRGIVHHYIQLAAITGGVTGNEPEITDCRPPPPGLGEGECCCVAVAPGESIQEAIDALPDVGGCVCLLPGVHSIVDTIRIGRSNITLMSESRAASMFMRGSDPLLLIGGVRAPVLGVRVERITFSRIGERSQMAAVIATSAHDCVITDCVLSLDRSGAFLGIYLQTCFDFTVERCRVAGALVAIAAAGGVSADLTITSNHIVCEGLEQGMPGLIGIMLDAALGGIVRDNDISGAGIGIGLNRAALVEVSGNRLVGTAEPPSESRGVLLASCLSVELRDNTVTGFGAGIATGQGRSNRCSGNELRACLTGALATEEFEPVFADNLVTGAATFGIAITGGSGQCDVSGNRLVHCGFTGALGVGLMALSLLGVWRVVDNAISDTGLHPGGNAAATLALSIAGLLVLETRVEGNLVGYTQADRRPVGAEDRALLLMGMTEFQVNDNIVLGFPAMILGNEFTGPGRSALVELRQRPASDTVMMRFERVTFSNNYCYHLVSDAQAREAATVVLCGRAGVAMGNQVKALARLPSFNWNGMTGPMIGNVMSGPAINHADLAPPTAPLNLIL